MVKIVSELSVEELKAKVGHKIVSLATGNFGVITDVHGDGRYGWDDPDVCTMFNDDPSTSNALFHSTCKYIALAEDEI